MIHLKPMRPFLNFCQQILDSRTRLRHKIGDLLDELRWLREAPLCRIALAELKSGDVVLLQYRRVLSPSAVDSLRAQWQEAMARAGIERISVVVMEDGLTAQIMRPVPPPPAKND